MASTFSWEDGGVTSARHTWVVTDPLHEAERRLAEHPGYRAHSEHDAFRRTLLHVFQANAVELVTVLDHAATDLDLALELVQNVHNDYVRQRYMATLDQKLHNYLAGTMSLVDHARRLLREHPGAFLPEYKRRLAALLANGVVPFMIDLRVYTQHRKLPMPYNSLSLKPGDATAESMRSELLLSTSALMQWRRWTPASRGYIQSQGEDIALGPAVKLHADLVYDHNKWLLEALWDDNRGPLEEANRLVIERNAALLGCSYDEALEFTQRNEAERDARPTPPRRFGPRDPA